MKFPYHSDLFIRFILLEVFIILSSNPSHFFTVAQILSPNSIQTTTTEDPLLGCHPPWREFATNSKCYYTPHGNGSTATLASAKQSCRKSGGDLVKPTSEEEHIFIRRILHTYDDTWIGATDLERKNWLDGTPMTYSNFPAVEESESGSNNDNNETKLCESPNNCCGLTTNKHGEWKYFSCDTILNYVCVKTNESVLAYRQTSNTKKHQQQQENEEQLDGGESGGNDNARQGRGGGGGLGEDFDTTNFSDDDDDNNNDITEDNKSSTENENKLQLQAANRNNNDEKRPDDANQKQQKLSSRDQNPTVNVENKGSSTISAQVTTLMVCTFLVYSMPLRFLTR